MPYFKCIKFRVAETQHFQKTCFSSSLGRHFSLNGEKDQRKVYPDEQMAGRIVGKS